MDLHKYECGRQYTVVDVNTCVHTDISYRHIHVWEARVIDRRAERAWKTNENCRANMRK
jgi:hypothetical protein